MMVDMPQEVIIDPAGGGGSELGRNTAPRNNGKDGDHHTRSKLRPNTRSRSLKRSNSSKRRVTKDLKDQLNGSSSSKSMMMSPEVEKKLHSSDGSIDVEDLEDRMEAPLRKSSTSKSSRSAGSSGSSDTLHSSSGSPGLPPRRGPPSRPQKAVSDVTGGGMGCKRTLELRREMMQRAMATSSAGSTASSTTGARSDERPERPTPRLPTLTSPTGSKPRKLNSMTRAGSVRTLERKKDPGNGVVTWERKAHHPRPKSLDRAANNKSPTRTTTSPTSEASAASAAVTPDGKKPKVPRGASMRKMLRHKRKEKHASAQHSAGDLFNFVLHKCPMDKYEGADKDGKPVVRQPNLPEEQQGQQQQPVASLDTFMKLKQQAEEEEEMRSQHTKSKKTRSNDACESIDFNESMVSLDLGNALGNHEEEEEEEEDVTVHSENSALGASSSRRESSHSKNYNNNSSNDTSDDSFGSLGDPLESHVLELSFDDVMEPQESNCKPCEDTEHVSDFAVIDPTGRKGIYKGPISKSSGMPCGEGRLEYADRGEIFEGQFIHGLWSGYGRCLYTKTGEDYMGCFHNRIRHGYGITRYSDGRVFEGTYDHNVPVEGRMTYKDGSWYLGQWSPRGIRHGRGTYTFPNGTVFCGEFKDDKLVGSGILTFPNGSRFIGKWKNGIRHGPGKELRPDGSIRREGLWECGKFT